MDFLRACIGVATCPIAYVALCISIVVMICGTIFFIVLYGFIVVFRAFSKSIKRLLSYWSPAPLQTTGTSDTHS